MYSKQLKVQIQHIYTNSIAIKAISSFNLQIAFALAKMWKQIPMTTNVIVWQFNKHSKICLKSINIQISKANVRSYIVCKNIYPALKLKFSYEMKAMTKWTLSRQNQLNEMKAKT